MTAELMAALINAAVTRAMIRAMGMTAENVYRESRGLTIAYDHDAFCAVIDEECIHHNTVMEMVNRAVQS